jgi:hypothetical protein
MNKCRIVTIEFNSLYLYYEIKRSLVHAASRLIFDINKIRTTHDES